MFGQNEIVGKAYFKNAPKDQLLVTSRFFTIQGEGIFRGWPAYFIRLAKCNLACSFCFVGSTRITMANSKRKKISDVVIGDVVLSYDKETGQFKPGTVTNTFRSEVDELICVRTTHSRTQSNSADKIYCTPNHPFLVRNKGWVNAEDLQEGDILIHLSSSEKMRLRNPRMMPEVNQFLKDKANTIERRLEASERLTNLYQSRPEMRINLSNRMKENNPMKDPEVALKGYLTREKREKTGVEKKFELITDGLPITFVGDGALTIAHKIPDFVVDGQNKVIEVWAEDALHAKDRGDEWKQKRTDLFRKHGYETLFLPIPPSGKKNGVYQQIREQVAEFVHNGQTVCSIERIKRGSGKAWTSLAGTNNSPCAVYNFEVDGYHTYIANGKVVHNCDTWFDAGEYYTFDQLLEEADRGINEYYNKQNLDVPNWAKERPNQKIVLVITGGEPSLQANLSSFLHQAQSRFALTQIESNGISVLKDLPDQTTLVVSPKCLEKERETIVHIGQPSAKRMVAVRYLEPSKDMLKRADCLKFVVCSPDIEQFTPYASVPDWALEWADKTGRPIFVSPMNIYLQEPQKAKALRAVKEEITIEERSVVDEVISFWEPGLLDMKKNQINHEYAAQYAMKIGAILNLQIHLYSSLP